MTLDNPSLTVELIDGQELVFPNSVGWSELWNQPVLDGLPIGSENTLDLIWDLVELSSLYPNTRVALKRHPVLHKWTALFLINVDNRWQRTHIETLNCEFCGWKGKSANPLVADLYFNFPPNKAFELLKIARDIPNARCPKCANKLPRPSIWVASK